MRTLIYTSLFLLGATSLFSQSLKTGIWQGVLTLNAEEKIELPFNFETKKQGKKNVIIIRNAEERILVDEVKLKKDSLNFKMPIFDSEFKTKIYGDSIVGVWINHARKDKNIIPFKAYFGKSQRFNRSIGKSSRRYFSNSFSILQIF